MSEETVKRVTVLAEPILFSQGMELVDVEYRREERGWVLRLTIDREGGVTLQDCAQVSQDVGRSLDVEDVISAPYHLEVSSPGLTRALKKDMDFVKYTNHPIKLKTIEPVENRRNFKGRLLGMVDGKVRIDVGDRVFEISLSNVSKANLELDF
jgi:ribosome maturation factor RimP